MAASPSKKRLRTDDSDDTAIEQEKVCLACGRKYDHNDDDDEPSGMDILTLNVGGKCTVQVLRRTLTQFEGTLLASTFSGRWKQVKDAQGKIFVNQRSDLFCPLVDYLVDKENETPGNEQPAPSLDTFGGDMDLYGAFLRMVEFYGLTPAMYPVWVVPLQSTLHELRLPYVSCGIQFVGSHLCRRLDVSIPGFRIKSFELFIDEVQRQREEMSSVACGWATDIDNPKWLEVGGVLPRWQLRGNHGPIMVQCSTTRLTIRGKSKSLIEGFKLPQSVPVDAIPVFAASSTCKLVNVTLEKCKDNDLAGSSS